MAFNLEKLAYGHTVDTSQILCNPTVVITFLKKSLVQIRGKYVTSPFSFLFRPTGNRAIRDSAAASRAAPAPLHHISAQLPKKPYKKKTAQPRNTRLRPSQPPNPREGGNQSSRTFSPPDLPPLAKDRSPHLLGSPR